MPGDVFSVFNNNRPTPAGPPTPAVSTTDPNTATANNSVTLPTNNATVTNPNTVSPTPSGDGTAVAQNPNQPTQANTNGPGPATDNPTQKVGDAVIVQNPTPTDPGTQQPRTLQGQVDTNQGANPFTNAVTRFTDGLAGAQAAGKVITDTIASLSQEARQQIVDAFNKFNEGTSLVEPSDRLSGSAIGILEGLGVVPNVQIADSGSSTGFTPLREALDNNSSQAFQESRQAGIVIGFGLPFVLEGGGAGRPPASSPELVPVGPGVGTPVDTPLVRAPETGPLETRVENNQGNQGPLQSKNEDPNNQQGGGGDTPLPLSQDSARQQQVAAEFKDVALGDVLGEGENKVVSAVQGRDDVAIGVLKPGKPDAIIDREIKNIETLQAQGLPTVDVIGKTTIDGQPATVTGRLEQGSKDIVKNVGKKASVVGESDLLNEKSIEDLTKIRSTLESRKIKINDLQFLIAKDGGIVVADPLEVFLGQDPSPNNLRTINRLIEAAQKNISEK